MHIRPTEGMLVLKYAEWFFLNKLASPRYRGRSLIFFPNAPKIGKIWLQSSIIPHQSSPKRKNQPMPKMQIQLQSSERFLTALYTQMHNIPFTNKRIFAF